MKLFVKLMALVLLAALVAPFFIRGPDGTPLMTPAAVKQQFSQTAGAARNRWRAGLRWLAGATGQDDPTAVEVYRWQDENGVWHYSDEKRPDGGSEVVRIQPDANLIRAEQIEGTTTTDGNAGAASAGGIITPGKALHVVEETKAAREQLEARDRAVEEASRQE